MYVLTEEDAFVIISCKIFIYTNMSKPLHDPTAKTLDGTTHLSLTSDSGIPRSRLEKEYLEDKNLQQRQDLALHDGLQAIVTGLITYKKQILKKLYENKLSPIPIITWQIPPIIKREYKTDSNFVSLMIVSNNDKLGLCFSDTVDGVFYVPTHNLAAARGAIRGDYPQEKIFWGRHLPIKSIVFNSNRTVTGATVRVASANTPLQGALYSYGLKSLAHDWISNRMKEIATQDLASILEVETHIT